MVYFGPGCRSDSFPGPTKCVESFHWPMTLELGHPVYRSTVPTSVVHTYIVVTSNQWTYQSIVIITITRSTTNIRLSVVINSLTTPLGVAVCMTHPVLPMGHPHLGEAIHFVNMATMARPVYSTGPPGASKVAP
jgi:hypothetical protein